MEQELTREIAIALMHGDNEYAELLRAEGFTRIEKDKAQPMRDNPKWAEQFIERKLRGDL